CIPSTLPFSIFPYTTLFRSVTGIAQQIPSVTWSNPAPIIYGTALGAAQLNASTPVAGTFAYNPPAGTFPDAGVYTLSVTFTPSRSEEHTSELQSPDHLVCRL